MTTLPRPKFQSVIQLTDSKVISKVRFDPDTSVLDIKMRSGNSYRYRQVDAYTFAHLVTDQSSGKVYNECIKNRKNYAWDGKTWLSSTRKATKLRW